MRMVDHVLQLLSYIGENIKQAALLISTDMTIELLLPILI